MSLCAGIAYRCAPQPRVAVRPNRVPLCASTAYGCALQPRIAVHRKPDGLARCEHVRLRHERRRVFHTELRMPMFRRPGGFPSGQARRDSSPAFTGADRVDATPSPRHLARDT